MKLVPRTVKAREAAPVPDRSWEVLACIFRALVFVTTFLLIHAH